MSAWWYESAACIGAQHIFDNDTAPAVAAALAICAGCPVRDACLADALRTETVGSIFGIRGGLTPDQRRKALPPVCQRCHTAPATGIRYCDTCRPIADRERRIRSEEKRRHAKQDAQRKRRAADALVSDDDARAAYNATERARVRGEQVDEETRRLARIYDRRKRQRTRDRRRAA